MPDTTHDAAGMNRRLAELLGWEPYEIDVLDNGVLGRFGYRYPGGRVFGLKTREEAEAMMAQSIPDFCHDANAALRALKAVRTDARWGEARDVRMYKHRDGPLQWSCGLYGRRPEGDVYAQADTLPAAVTLACIAALERLGEEAKHG